MSGAALFAGVYTWLAALAITMTVLGQVRPSIGWPGAVLCTFAGRAAMRVVRLETAGRFRP